MKISPFCYEWWWDYAKGRIALKILYNFTTIFIFLPLQYIFLHEKNG